MELTRFTRIAYFCLVVVLFILISGCVTTARDWNQDGMTDQAMGRYDEAVKDFDHAVALDPGYAEAWSNRGLTLALLGRTTESEESFRKAIAIDPQRIGSYYYQALARNATGNIPGALESLDKAAGIRPRDRDEAIDLFSSLKLRGDLLTAMGRSDEANASYSAAHAIEMATI